MAIYEKPALFFTPDPSHPKAFHIMEDIVDSAGQADKENISATAEEAKARRVTASYRTTMIEKEISRMDSEEELKDIKQLEQRYETAEKLATSLMPKAGEVASDRYTKARQRADELADKLLELL